MSKILNYLMLFFIFMLSGGLIALFIYSGFDIPTKTRGLVVVIAFLLTLGTAMVNYLNGD